MRVIFLDSARLYIFLFIHVKLFRPLLPIDKYKNDLKGCGDAEMRENEKIRAC